MLRKQTTFILALFVSMMTVLSYAQDQNTLPEEVWSKIKVKNNDVIQHQTDFEYIPVPQVTRYFDLKEGTDATVSPNFRPWPTTNTTQSELSVDVHPTNSDIIFASANATPWPVSGIYGTGVYWSLNGTTTWTGFDNPPFGGNSGDPVSVIGTNGYFYEGYINNSSGQGISVSSNNGTSWSSYTVAPNPGSLADKNHLMVDRHPGSPFENRVYAAWTDFGGTNDYDVVFKWSSNNGQTWSAAINISNSLNSYLNQGVNIQTGPNGEVYVIWAVYATSPVTNGEDGIGFAKSTDGGVTFSVPSYIYQATNFGIRGTLSSKSGIRVSSFPSAAVDRSGGINHGNIYVTWPQRGVAPAGSDPDIVSVRSINGGDNWSAPVRVNSDPMNNGKDQYYPWMTVDQATGQVNYVFYDSRDVNNDSAQVYMARSLDGAQTFENIKISDGKFKPAPISGLAGGYQGDYIGIAALNNIAYPYWAESRTGVYQGWMAVVTFGPGISHTPLTNTENLAGPYVINCTIESTNPLNPNRIYMHWGRGALTDSVLMTNTTGNNYTASIPGNGLPAVYRYYIYAEDNTGATGTLPGGAPGNYFSFEAATDIVPPVISHNPLGNQPEIRWPSDVSADVTDNIGVDTVSCEYRVNNGALTGSFLMPLVSGNTYEGIFPIDTALIAIGDSVEYRIRARDNSNGGNIGFSPASGYYKFYIIDVKGVVLVVDADVTLEARISPEKGSGGDLVTPLGASSTLFANTLVADGYAVDEVTFSAMNPATLDDYDIVILSGGVATTNMFNDATKRTAVINYTLAGGKTIVEGGEVGYIYRQQTTEVDVNFRRTLLLDSSWISDVSGGSLLVRVPAHPMFNNPNTIPGTVAVTNSSGSGYGARDAMRILPNVPGVRKLAGWSTYPDSAGIFIYYVNNDTTQPRNIFFSFSVGQITDQNIAANLIENAVWILSPANSVVPVELVSFNANANGNNVNLNWTTATEVNNSGFAVERRTAGTMFERIGFVRGNGSTTQASVYSFTDSKLPDGNYTYRLKQIDYDGTTSYSNEVNVEVASPRVFALDQNYPNPFNPSTVIKYSIPADGFVTLAVYNLLGEKVATLVNDNLKAGGHEVNFDASNLSSGVYFYRLESGSFTAVKKLMLLK
ncbi:MAG: T9SS type A sorting domain-containing protein [Ignavibacteriales bacterium]|nr:MAG: T9SS type A sorting domain-containing protein [Ignavibacteriales bacterium]